MNSKTADGSTALATALRRDEAELNSESLRRAMRYFFLEAVACGAGLFLIAWVRAAWIEPLDPGVGPTPAMNFYSLGQKVLLAVMIGLPVFRVARATVHFILERRRLSQRSDEALLHEDLLRRML